ncbi:MAG: Ig-like domain-containing protein, partial [Opitutaceae bacterium]
AGDQGSNSFVVQVNDNNGYSDTATMGIEVGAAGSGWNTLASDDFESGFGSWTSGGSDCLLSTATPYSWETQSMRIQNDSATSHAILALDLSGSNELLIDYTYMTQFFDAVNGEGFSLLYSSNGGSTWTTVKDYVVGTDMSNDVRGHETVTLTDASYSFTSDAQLKFMTIVTGTTGAGEGVHLDNVVVSARNTSGGTSNTAPVFTADPIDSSNATENIAYIDSIAGTATDTDNDTLSYSKVSGPSWLGVSVVGQLSGTPGTGDIGGNTFTVQVSDGNGGSDSATLNITVDADVGSGGPVDDLASGETLVAGVLNGSFADTYSSDNVYESLTEVLSGGKPSKRYSVAEHKWTIVVNGGNSVIFFVEAHKTANSEGDDFVFAYSTDDVNYTDMVTVTKTSDDDTVQQYTLPNATSGTVYIRVTDTDSTAGNQNMDTVYVDEMYIRSDGEAPANQAPSFSSDPIVEVDANENVAYSATLAGDASDPEGDSLSFSKVSGPAWLSVATDGSLSGTPAAGDVGVNLFTVQVDATGGSDTATLEITVIAAGATPPGQASNPTPTDGQQRVQNPILSWTAGSDATTHNVYFGITSGSLSLVSSQSGTSYDPGSLSGKTWHYWRIDEVNANGTTTGVEWSFKSK